MGGEPLETVFETNFQWEAELVRGLLAENGIVAHVAFDSLGTVYGLDGMSFTKVQTLREDVEAARALIEEYQSNNPVDDPET